MDLGGIATLITALAGAFAGVAGVLRAKSSGARADAAESKIDEETEERTGAIHRLETEVEALGRVADRALARATACEDREAKTDEEMAAMRARLDHLERLVAARGRR
ncbi:MAG TPA: hypothetical protein VGR26_15085 [Acidimicrobiales bacterium]|nr:hypothetical protein [Acidimicrobiales bacterium]